MCGACKDTRAYAFGTDLKCIYSKMLACTVASLHRPRHSRLVRPAIPNKITHTQTHHCIYNTTRVDTTHAQERWHCICMQFYILQIRVRGVSGMQVFFRLDGAARRALGGQRHSNSQQNVACSYAASRTLRIEYCRHILR